VPSGNYVKFISAYLGERGESLSEEEGDLVTTTGEVVAAIAVVHKLHRGAAQGIGNCGRKALYVVELDRAANRVVVGDDCDLRTAICQIRDMNWISFAALEGPVRAAVKIRHRHEPAPATVEPIDETSARVIFDEPQRAITPGQTAVCYSGEVVLGRRLDSLGWFFVAQASRRRLLRRESAWKTAGGTPAPQKSARQCETRRTAIKSCEPLCLL